VWTEQNIRQSAIVFYSGKVKKYDWTPRIVIDTGYQVWYNMGMDTVYRIQSKANKEAGAYSVWPCPISDKMAKAHNGNITHPQPKYDKGIERSIQVAREHCGCETAEDLLRWFKGFIPDLLRAGFEIVKLTNVTITAYGSYQVLFTF
jgi:hypothetical protein